MTKNPKNLWHNVDGDPLGDVDPDANAPGLNYLRADMDEIAEGVDAASLVWLRLLQLRRMRPRDEYVLLGQDWLTHHGVSRYAKYRALEKFERQKLSAPLAPSWPPRQAFSEAAQIRTPA